MNKFLFYKLLLSTTFFLLISSIVATSQCAITDLVITESECDENDEFSVEINFNFVDTGSSGFQVLGNGNNYGIFQYEDLPITLNSLAGNCETEYEFIVRDVMDPTCAAFVEYGTVCCEAECGILIFANVVSDCMDNTFNISLGVESLNSGDNGFNVSINGEPYGNYSYDIVPVNIEGITSSIEGLNTITVCDDDFPDCCYSRDFLNPCVCSITSITSEIIECDSEDSTYYVIIDFDHIVTNDSFQMGFSNGGTNVFLGVFAYSDLPVTAGPLFLLEEEQEIFIADKENFFCFNSAYLGIVDDCIIECQIYNVFGEAYMCEDGEYYMDVEFEAKDIQGYSFEILVDNVNYGTFEYGENSYTIGPIPSNCESAPVVLILDSEMEFCADFYNFSEPICCLPDCNFTSFEVIPDCGPTMLTLNGTFENNGTMLGAFYFVEFMGTSYGPFLYGDFMFSVEVPLLDNGTYQININDSLDPECQASTTFIVQCDEEPCIIFDVNAEAHPCEENQFYVDIEFEFAGDVSDFFDISSNGATFGPFEYGENFYTVGPFEGDCETLYEFFISDQIQEGCNSFYGFQEPICCSAPCSIRDIQVIDYTCNVDNDGLIGFTLDFIYEDISSDMFDLIVNGMDLGSFSYSDLPLPLNLELPISFVIEIQDSENTECQDAQEFEFICPQCIISDFSLDSIECIEDGLFYATLNFNHENTTDSFLIISAGNPDTALYSDLPLRVGPFIVGLSFNFSIIDFGGGCVFEDWILVEEDDCLVGLEEAAFSNIDIIQSGTSVTIENNEAESLKFSLFSMTGALIHTMEIRSNLQETFDTSLMSSGLYLLNISNQRNQKTIKLVVY